MRLHTSIFVLGATALWVVGATQAQISNPIPEAVVHRGLNIEIREVARLPDSSGMHPVIDGSPTGWARISFVRDLPDGRRFANDSRGPLYLLDQNNEPSVYADISAAFQNAFYDSLQSGFIGFEFHPEFAQNGLFYTAHAEKGIAGSATPHFIPPGFSRDDVTYQSVITEWRATDPAANVFEGTRRELLRVGHVVEWFRHPFGYVGFNPTSEPGDPDYGLLYTSGSDLGFSNGGGPNAGDPSQLQRLDTLLGAILRIDPRSPSESGGTKGVGDYTIPAINQFAADDDPQTFGEIYAYGFRNAHRLSWDLADGTMYAADIGMSQIEEINIVREGNNYGWMQREGPFDNGVNFPGGVLGEVFPLPADILDGRREDGFTYPVAMYDHGEGQAITAGFAYRGNIPELRGKFVFGELVRGRLFAADVAAMKAADDGIPQTTAPIEEIQLFVRDASGNRTNVTLWDLVDGGIRRTITRVDLQISQSRDGELFITSRQDGTIRMLVADIGSTEPTP
jgi:hypothetical protein